MQDEEKNLLLLNEQTNQIFDLQSFIQPERSKREDLVYKEPDFDKMKIENPVLYSKYEAAKNALRCGALNIVETQ